MKVALPCLVTATLLLLLGCGGGGASSTRCTMTAQCDDGVYCNGIEICSPGNPGADEKGCVTIATPTCPAGLKCSNYGQTCTAICTGRFPELPGCLNVCKGDGDCDDGAFCNGTARCVGTEMAATLANGDARGCAITPQPCRADQTCDEAANRCVDQCTDADGDGHGAVNCGGDDCDDTDPNVHPGAVEVCDGAKKDEDCDPTTFGVRDGDGDGYVSNACCNGTRCGDDCDDGRISVHPGATEVCNGIDDSCVGAIDDGVTVPLYVDADRDGYGTGQPVQGCLGMMAGYSLLGNDCDDKNAAITPGVMVCLPAEGLQAFATCTSAGTYAASKCPLQKTCSTQPNGVGLCL